MRVMTVHLDEILTLIDNDLRGLVLNEELSRPKHTISPASGPRPWKDDSTGPRTGSLIA